MKRFAMLFLALLTICCMANPVQVKAASAQQKVTVEAEGSGSTEMDALKSAWMEAVRKAVGMFMVGTTEMINDDLTEQLATYSRGQVNSYEVLSKKQNNGIWNVKIRANIDQDRLRETASKHMHTTAVQVDDNMVAQAATANEKAASLEAVIEASAKLFDFTGLLVYESRIVQNEDPKNKGKQAFFMQHKLSFDLEKYNQRLMELHKFFEKIATGKREVAYTDQKTFKNLLGSLKTNEWSDIILGKGTFYICGDDFDSTFYKCIGNFPHTVLVPKNSSTGIVYTLNESAWKKLSETLVNDGGRTLRFNIGIGDGLLGEHISTGNVHIAVGIFSSYYGLCIRNGNPVQWIIAPVLSHFTNNYGCGVGGGDGGLNKVFGRLIVNQQMDLSPEVLQKRKNEIKSGYVLDPWQMKED